MPEKMLTLAQVASRVGLDSSTVGKWVRRKAFPGAIRANDKGRYRWLIPVSSVAAFLKRRKGMASK